MGSRLNLKNYIYLRKCTEENKKNATHRGMSSWSGNFIIDNKEFKHFFKLYDTCINDNINVCLTEIPIEIGPATFDFDFKIDFDEKYDLSKKIYTEKQIELLIIELFKICKQYFKNVILPFDFIEYTKEDDEYNEYFEKLQNTEYFEILLMEKNKCSIKGKEKNKIGSGFHIFINKPFTFQQRFFIFHLLKESAIKKKIFEGFNYDEVFDYSTIKNNGWLLYGSTKNEESTTYKITKNYVREYYKDDEDKIISRLAYSDIYDYQPEYLSILNFKNADPIKFIEMNDDEMEIVNQQLEEYYNLYTIDKKKQKKENFNESKQNISNNNDYNIEEYKNNNNFQMIYDFINNCYSIDRAYIYHTWRAFGYAINNSFNFEEGLKLFLEFSKKSSNYCEEDVITFFKEIKGDKDGYRYGSLKLWAKLDNEIEYNKILIKYNHTEESILEVIENEQLLGQNLSLKLEDKYIYDGKFYFFDDNFKIWKIDEAKDCDKKTSAINLKMLNDCSNILIDEIKKINKGLELSKTKLSNDSKLCEEEKEKKIIKIDRQIKENIRILNKSVKSSYLKPIINDRLSYFMTQTDFYLTLDRKRNLLSFKNGILDLSTGIFRDRTKEDLISTYLKYNYTNKINKEKYEDVKKIIFQIANEDAETFNYILDYMGTCLTGDRVNHCLFFVGPRAGNGKSTITEILKKCIPEYSFNSSPKTFDANFANAHKMISEMNLKRFVYIEELENKNIDSGILKTFITVPSIQNQVLFATTKEIHLENSLITSSNFDPVVIENKNDEGLGRRIIIVYCNNKFIDEVEYNKLTDKTGFFICRNDISELFDDSEYKNALINLLLEHTILFYKNNRKINIPEKIDNNYKTLAKMSDNIGNFIDEYYEKSNDYDIIHKDTFTELYKQISNKNIVDFNKDLLHNIRAKGFKYDCYKEKWINGKKYKGFIFGLKLKIQNADIENEEIN